MDVLGSLFGAGTVVLAIGVNVPQYLRFRRDGSTAGVSLPAMVNSVISFIAWIVYSLRIGDAWLIASSALGLPFAAATAYAAWRSGASRSGLWVPTLWVWILLCSSAIQWLEGWSLANLAVGASMGWFVTPAAIKAWRSADISGVAAGSWWIVVTEGAVYLGYGLVSGASSSTVCGIVTLLGSGAVLTRLALGNPGDPVHGPLAVPDVGEDLAQHMTRVWT